MYRKKTIKQRKAVQLTTVRTSFRGVDSPRSLESGNAGDDKSNLLKDLSIFAYTHWIGLRENLQETMVFLPSNWSGFPVKIFP